MGTPIGLPPGFKLDDDVDTGLPPGFTLDDSAESAAQSPAPAKRTMLDSAGDFTRNLWQQVNPIAGIKGLRDLANHPIGALKSDAAARGQIGREAIGALRSGDYGKGISRGLYSAIPFLGPGMADAAQKFERREFAAGAGQSVGMGLNIAGPGALKNANVTARLPQAAGRVAEKVYKSTLKPSTTIPQPRVAQIVKTGLEHNIPISEKGLAKLGSLIDDVNAKISAEIAANPKAKIRIGNVTSKLDDVRNKFANQVTPEADLAAIDSAKAEFRNQFRSKPGGAVSDIPADKAQAIKVGTYQQLKSKAYGELKNATIEAQKALARGTKEELVRVFPELKNLNAADSRFLQLDPVLERAVRRTENNNIFGLRGAIASGAAGTATAAFTGNPLAAVGASAAALMADVLTNPSVQSQLAIALHRGSKGKITLKAAKVRVQGYVNALGQTQQAERQSRSPELAPAY